MYILYLYFFRFYYYFNLTCSHSAETNSKYQPTTDRFLVKTDPAAAAITLNIGILFKVYFPKLYIYKKKGQYDKQDILLFKNVLHTSTLRSYFNTLFGINIHFSIFIYIIMT